MSGASKQTCICKICGATFLGKSTAFYCEPCRVQRNKELARKSYEKKRAAELSGSAKEEDTSEEKCEPGKPNTKQCKGCIYKGTCDGFVCCNYLLYTGHCRERDGNICLSKSTSGTKPPLSPWGEGVTGGNTLAGYKY